MTPRMPTASATVAPAALDLRPILYALGILVSMLGTGMAVPATVDLLSGHPGWPAFVIALAVTVTVGGMMALAARGTGDKLTLRQAFLLTALAWIVLPAFAAIPLAFSELGLSYTDAYFEAMSGLTTTGATVISGLDDAPPGLLMWRAILQWLGGIGIVVMAVAVLPMLQVGGMQLFRMESSDTSEKILPRAAQISVAILGLYLGLTALCTLCLILAGLNIFDAIAHAMTTIATGGFSTRDGSVGHFDNGAVDMIVLTFMIVGSMPFVLYLQALRGRPLALWRDEQARTFLAVILFLTAGTCLWLVVWLDFTPWQAFRFGSFNIVSIMTGTGYATTDYGAWGSFSLTLFFLVMLIGGCAGSTSCGIKIFRFQVLFKSLGCWLRAMVHPNGVFIPRYNGRPIAEDVQTSVMTFLVFFLGCMVILAFALALTGLDWMTAFSGAATAMANVGPGLGETIGPAGNFETLPDSAKWLLSFGMLLGRLELFTVLVMLMPSFWRG